MPKLLIVDDEEATVDMLSTYLGLIGHETISAINGQDGLRKAQAENPDMMLLDLMMPDLQGYEVCSNLRTQSAYSSMPILIISARTDQGSIDKAMSSGADGYFTKPLDLLSLTQAIDRLLANPPTHPAVDNTATPQSSATQSTENLSSAEVKPARAEADPVTETQSQATEKKSLSKADNGTQDNPLASTADDNKPAQTS